MTEEFNINFVGLVERHPCLYDQTRVDYSLRHVTEAAWHDVAKQCNESVKTCKDKWKNLRTVYRRNYVNKPTGSSFKRPYYLNDAMKFMIPFIQATLKQTDATIPDEFPEEEERISVKMEKDDDEYENPEDIAAEFAEMHAQPQLFAAAVAVADRNGEVPTSRSSRKRSTTDSIERIQMDTFKRRAREGPALDADEMFLLSLKPDLEEMTASQKRKFKSSVFDLIDKILHQ